MAPYALKTFLEEVAEDLYTRYGDEISACRILFPSRRARLFFVDALTRLVNRPIWQPRWVALDELMSTISGLHVGDKLRLVTELYKVYSEFHEESFDKFYFWGELLLSDFDMVDKYRIDAAQLFRNIEELKELEADISYLTPHQLEIISRFWSSLGSDADLTKEKRRFLAIWRTLHTIYVRFRERLLSLGIAYEGLMQRVAIERLESQSWEFNGDEHFVVAGFNALSTCERALFRAMQMRTHTDFYWDCDRYYADHEEQEAGMFIRRNRADFPPVKRLSEEKMNQSKQMVSVATVSNAVQCKYAAEVLAQWAKEHPLDKETAVVLTDENLLMPLLYALPEAVGKVNVTMGYPLRQTLVYTFIERLIALQHQARLEHEEWSFYHTDVSGLLTHPLVAHSDEKLFFAMQEEVVNKRMIRLTSSWLCRHPLLTKIFQGANDWQSLSDWLLKVLESIARLPYEGDDAARRTEFLSVAATEIHKLRNSLDQCDLRITNEVYCSLLRRHLQTLRVPFEGEPLEGVQVMGILETRSLDFRNVLILSMNDDNFPGNHMLQASFIPYNLRAAFELPTPEHHEGVYAYYFYRLIQRAERVTMLYCSHADDKSTGEASRYIRQLDYESPHTIERVEVGVDVNLMQAEPIEVAKSEQIMQSLYRFVDPKSSATLSPTALYRYVACPLRFYFHSVARLKSEDLVTEEVDAPMFGTILHGAVQELYGRIAGEYRPGNSLQALLRAGEVERAVDKSIAEHYLNNPDAGVETYPGNLLLVRDIVVRYIKRGVVAYDVKHDDFAVLGLETDVAWQFPFEVEGQTLRLKLGGIADRIDRLGDGKLRVVDYKTGTAHLDFKGLEALFQGEARDRQSNTIQTLLYAMMLHHSEQCDVVPALYYVRNMHRDDYAPWLIDCEKQKTGIPYSRYAALFESLLAETLATLFDPNIPFTQVKDDKACQYCDFKLICRR
ncbi:MAG: exodeoxyribonuclease V subunit gamma [Alistipes sp.]|nr:exodeoxyribonuclease V subunit gamma [Alistipes sp.]